MPLTQKINVDIFVGWDLVLFKLESNWAEQNINKSCAIGSAFFFSQRNGICSLHSYEEYSAYKNTSVYEKVVRIKIKAAKVCTKDYEAC